MVLAAENDDETQVGLILSNAKIGTNLICDKDIADNVSQITIDDFAKIKMISKGNKIYIQKDDKLIEFTDGNNTISVDKNLSGKIK